MNKRKKKKLLKKINTSVELGLDHTASYREIKWINKMYHEYDLAMRKVSNICNSLDYPTIEEVNYEIIF